MRVQSTWISLVSRRAFATAEHGLNASQRRLSSGLRINVAADDASGLGMSHTILGQFRGLMQANRNALDGVSLLNTAEGALHEIQTLIKRGYELSVQASNGTLTRSDREKLQIELNGILREIDRIVDTTTFNNKKLLNAAGSSADLATIVNGLRSGWLENAANVIRDNYGIEGDGIGLQIVFEHGGPGAAWVTGDPVAGGMLDNLVLHIDAQQLTGDMSHIAHDRKIARALTQAVLARNADYFNAPDWFKSGVADYIAGRDEQLAADIAEHGLATVIGAIATPWQDDNLHQSAAYLLVKYMESQLFPGDTLRNLFDELKNGNPAFDLALLTLMGMDSSALLNNFLDPGAYGGAAFAATLDLTDADVGGIGTGDNDTVIPDGGTYSNTPLAPAFQVQLSSTTFDPVHIRLQVGANVGDVIDVYIPHVSTFGLNLVGIDLVNRAQEAISLFTEAVKKVTSARAELGSMVNRLEVTVNANNNGAESQLSSYSRIVDVDFAKEMAVQTRQQILMRSTSAMLAQANTARQHVLWLLKDLSTTTMAPPAIQAAPSF